MSNDDPFRIAMLVGMSLLIPVMAYFRIRSQLTGESLDRRQEGWFILITLRLVALFGAVVMIRFSSILLSHAGPRCHCRRGCGGAASPSEPPPECGSSGRSVILVRT